VRVYSAPGMAIFSGFLDHFGIIQVYMQCLALLPDIDLVSRHPVVHQPDAFLIAFIQDKVNMWRCDDFSEWFEGGVNFLRPCGRNENDNGQDYWDQLLHN